MIRATRTRYAAHQPFNQARAAAALVESGATAAADNANTIYQLTTGGTTYGPRGTSIWGSGWNSTVFTSRFVKIFCTTPVSGWGKVTRASLMRRR